MHDNRFYEHAVLQDLHRLFSLIDERNLIEVALFLYDQQDPYLPQTH